MEGALFFPCWHLWLARNERIFHNQSSSQPCLVHKVVQLAIFIWLALLKQLKYVPRIIKWIAPLEPFIKLNIDGSSLGNLRLAGASGLLRNCSGSWVSGFSLNMGIASNNIAKLGAIRQDLILAWDLGFKFIHLEIDSMAVLS